LKKQSQFQNSQNDVSSFVTSKYEKFGDSAAVKNKAKQSQSFDFAQDRFISRGHCPRFDWEKEDG